MRPRRVGGFRPFARAGAIASIALIGMMFSANAAFAATVIGATGANTLCNQAFDLVQMSSSAGTFAVPTGGGSISSWSSESGSFLGQIALQVWRPTATADVYQLVGTSPLVTPPLAFTVNSYNLATPIPVQAGDLLGLRVDTKANCALFSAGVVGDNYGAHMGASPALDGTASFISNVGTLNVTATVDAVIPPPPPPPPWRRPQGCLRG